MAWAPQGRVPPRGQQFHEEMLDDRHLVPGVLLVAVDNYVLLLHHGVIWCSAKEIS